MTQDPKAVANFFLDLAERDGKALTARDLQDLVFAAHVVSLSRVGKPLIGEAFFAWPDGAMAYSLYYELQGQGARPVTDYMARLNPNGHGMLPYMVSFADTPEGQLEGDRVEDVIVSVWKEFPDSTLRSYLDEAKQHIYREHGEPGQLIPPHALLEFAQHAGGRLAAAAGS